MRVIMFFNNAISYSLFVILVICPPFAMIGTFPSCHDYCENPYFKV
uniref:Uncharacterized protein n=1 Tax=Bartonella schoenbuchensis (strain DSM 13525 / NCTC 13165 / R1) TaxID=687861 RepID=E6Z1B8_BARSR|nr:exported hypothetical protein [Bartonella schoenbuchensis R1]